MWLILRIDLLRIKWSAFLSRILLSDGIVPFLHAAEFGLLIFYDVCFYV